MRGQVDGQVEEVGRGRLLPPHATAPAPARVPVPAGILAYLHPSSYLPCRRPEGPDSPDTNNICPSGRAAAPSPSPFILFLVPLVLALVGGTCARGSLNDALFFQLPVRSTHTRATRPRLLFNFGMTPAVLCAAEGWVWVRFPATKVFLPWLKMAGGLVPRVGGWRLSDTEILPLPRLLMRTLKKVAGSHCPVPPVQSRGIGSGMRLRDADTPRPLAARAVEYLRCTKGKGRKRKCSRGCWPGLLAYAV